MSKQKEIAPTVQPPARAPAEVDLEGLLIDQPYVIIGEIHRYLGVAEGITLAAARAGVIASRGISGHPSQVEIQRESLIAWLRDGGAPYVPVPEAAVVARAKRAIAEESARHAKALRVLDEEIRQAEWAIAERRDAEHKAARQDRNRQRYEEDNPKATAPRCY